MRRLVSLGLSFLLLAVAIGCAAPEASQAGQPLPPQPEPAELSSDEEIFDALDTEALLDIGYSEPDKTVIVEGVVVRGFYAETSKGSPTFLDFHDPYQDWFKCVIWCEDKETLEPVRDRFIAAFPPDPETYFLNKRVRVSGKINIYKGAPEIILTEPVQIWVVSKAGEYEVLVSRVIDGDTIEVLGGERVRYIGIDAPETGEYFAAEATEKNRELVEGKRVRLESDVEDRDEYGRLLRYVWLDDIMVNAELVRLGYAYSYSLVPNVKYRQLFLQSEREARKLCRGLWVE
jgi:micrococcal nuclease